MKIRPEDALEYHSSSPAGKLSVTPTKPCRTQRDLSLAYTPGVAVPCLEIERDPSLAYKYTAKGNLVGVVSQRHRRARPRQHRRPGRQAGDGRQGRPVQALRRYRRLRHRARHRETPTRSSAPARFWSPPSAASTWKTSRRRSASTSRRRCSKTMKIPVFHDDQHGTAIICGAGLINALEIGGKNIDDVKVVFNGAGAAAISCAAHYVRPRRARREHRHVRHQGRDLRGPHRAHERVQGALRLDDRGAHPGRSHGRRRRLLRTLQRGLRHARTW